jgi:thiamine pyrophosphokinase
MNPKTIKLDIYQNSHADLDKKLGMLKLQDVIVILGPMLQYLPKNHLQNVVLQVDSNHLDVNHQTIILGDADSVLDEHKNIFDYLFPTQKNFTDFEALIEFLKIHSKAKHLHFYGFWGGRFDHQHLIPCQITELLLQCSNLRSAWIYDENNSERLEILSNGNHAFNEQNYFSLISPSAQTMEIQGEVEYQGKFQLSAWSGLGLSNHAKGSWSIQCQLPIWKYILSNDEHPKAKN